MRMRRQRLVHPGAILWHEFMKPLALSSYKVAKELGVSIPTVNDMVRERRAVTAAMALRLSRYFGTKPNLWQNLQAEFDLERARRKVGVSVTKRIKPLSRRALQKLVAQRALKKARGNAGKLR
jgi:addiction module HigA family antidote